MDLVFFLFLLRTQSQAFVTERSTRNLPSIAIATKTTKILAKPARLVENVNGVLYVNDQCINCQACAGFAPETFRRLENQSYHIVHRQPETQAEIVRAQAALRACPVAAIRLETLAERRHGAVDVDMIQSEWEKSGSCELARKLSDRTVRSFPRPFLEGGAVAPGLTSPIDQTTKAIRDVYWTGHHNEDSFGAIPYIVKGNVRDQEMNETAFVYVMVDTPKYSKAAVSDIASIVPQGPDYLFLTHVDDTADHEKWANEFPNMKQIFHEGDLGRYNWIGDESLADVDILLTTAKSCTHDSMLSAFSLNGSPVDLSHWLSIDDGDSMDLIILHSPGHSFGSISLYRRDGVLFTGDTYAATQLPQNKGIVMTGFPRYGRDLDLQANTLDKMLMIPFQVVAPGHGLARDYRDEPSLREPELRRSQQDLRRNC